MKNNHPIYTLLRSAAVLLSAALLLVGYYWIHKPADGSTLLRYAGYGLDAAVTFALIVIAAGIGRAATTLFFARTGLVPGIHRAERLALDGGIGLAIVSTGGLALGAVGGFKQIALIAALAAAAILFRKPIRGWLSDSAAMARAIRFESRFTGFLIIVTLLLLGLAFVGTLTPPYAWDAMSYHLIEPRHLVETGRVTASSTNFYLGFPKAVETLFAIVMGITGRDTGTALVHYSIGILALLAAAGCARRLANPQAGWLAVALLLSSFNTWQLLNWQYVDMAVMLYGMLAFIIALRWHESGESRWLILLGLSCGFGFGVKYSYGSLILALAIFIIVRQPRRMIPNLLMFGLAAAIAYAPWALRGLLLYGNPIYPYLLGGLNWSAERTTAFNQAGLSMRESNQLGELPFLPFTATILGFNYGPSYSYTLGPFLLTLPFLLLATWSHLPAAIKRLAINGAIILLPIYIYWAVSMAFLGIATQTRLVIVILPISAVLGAVAVQTLDLLPEKPVNLGFLIRAMIVLTTAFSVIDTIGYVAKTRSFEVVLGTTSEEEFLFGQLSTFPAVMSRLAELPDDSQIRFLYEVRSYYCPENVTCIADSLLDFWGNARHSGMTADEIFETWRANGDDYLLMFNSGYQAAQQFSPMPEYDREAGAELEAHLIPVWTSSSGFYTLYTWR
ncbi:MAG: hypothetical protein UZ15_CFX003000890 [Chloroflexi bacterium OLB15]|nr:MAG: hypothetical protein UZ15_CFX003000890 [Chloroflexi bacterium OLB15]